MKPAETIILFLSLVFAAEASSFEIKCNSTFTTDGTSFCVGVPIECEVMLDPDLCIVGEDLVTEEDLEVTLKDSRTGHHANLTFRSLQENSTLMIEIDYIPMYNLSTIEVNVSLNLTTNCSFELLYNDLARSMPIIECLYPLLINVTYFEPYIPAYVRGGDAIMLTVELNAGTLLEELVIFIDCHPALYLKNVIFYRLHDGNSSVNVEYYHTHPYNRSFLLGVVEMENETLFLDLCFWLQPFVLPDSDIYIFFRVHYFVPSYQGNNSFFQTLNINDVYRTPEVVRGNLSFSLPYYDEIDYVEFTFPPHVGDPFVIKLPITVPCVSTDLNITLSIPEFISDNYTMFLINITNIAFELPENLIFINELCNYTAYEPHGYDHLCYVDYSDIAYDRPYVVEQQMEELGVDLLFIDFGPILYKLSCHNHTYYNYTNCTGDELIEHYGEIFTCEEVQYWYEYWYNYTAYNYTDYNYTNGQRYYNYTNGQRYYNYTNAQHYYHHFHYYHQYFHEHHHHHHPSYHHLHYHVKCEELLDLYDYWLNYTIYSNCTDDELIDHYGRNVSCDEILYWYSFWYNYSCSYDNCTDNCTCGCGCGDGDQITVIVTGLVAPNLQCEEEIDERLQCFVCENQTLADNITWELDYMKEVSFQMDFNTEVEYVVVRDDEIAAVNASVPAMSIPINSFSGDAGDSYNLTFGVLHNADYSSFTAYDLNYTFTVNEHLHPASFIKICFTNGSGDPFICEDHPFINQHIVRAGFHPK